MLISNVYINVLSFALIFLFGYTALDKLIHLHTNTVVLSHMPFIQDMAAMLAVGIPAVEIATVLLLLNPRTNKSGLYVSLVLMLFFTVYLVGMLLMKVKLPCTCGGILEQMTWEQHIVFNLIVMGLIGGGLRGKHVAN